MHAFICSITNCSIFFKHDIMRPFFCRVQLKEQLTKTEYYLIILIRLYAMPDVYDVN